jgi:hypothetical protein
MKLLPKSPLDSSPLERRTERRRSYFRKAVRSKICSLKKSREEEKGDRGRERETDASAYGHQEKNRKN